MAANTTRAELVKKIAAKFPPMSMANPTNSDLYAVLLELLDAGDSPEQRAVTAVASTGVALTGDDEYVIVTSGNTAHLVVLPNLDDVSPGKLIILEAGATGFALATGVVGDRINNVAASVGVASAAIPATGLAYCRAHTAAAGSARGWSLQYFTELGALATAIVPA